MSIKLGDNIQVQIPKPLDSKYLNDTNPYTGTTQVNTCIASGLRSIGLTVNISNIEYWYCGGTADGNLVIKGGSSSSLSEFTITGNSTATGFTVNHAKNKQFVAVEVVRGSSPYDTVYTSVQRPNVN